MEDFPTCIVQGRKDRLALRLAVLRRVGFTIAPRVRKLPFGFVSYRVIFPSALSREKAARIARHIVASSQPLRIGHIAERLFTLAGERPGGFGRHMRLKRRLHKLTHGRDATP